MPPEVGSRKTGSASLDLDTLGVDLATGSRARPLASMRSWRPKPSPFRFVLAILPMLCIALAVWLWTFLASRVSQVAFDPGVFLLGLAFSLALTLAGMIAYMAWCAFTMLYSMSGDYLYIKYGGTRYVIPVESIATVHPPGGVTGKKALAIRWRGAADTIPGYVVGEGRSAELGRVVAVSTTLAGEQVFLVTPGATFALSPQNATGFISYLNRLRGTAIGADDLSARAELSGPSSWAAGLWADRLARYLFLSGIALCALLFGYLSLEYGALPARLALHWNSQAQIDRIGDPNELLRLPAMALGVWLVNAVVAWWALPRERAASLFLLAGAVAAQIVFAAGVVSIVLRATS